MTAREFLLRNARIARRITAVSVTAAAVSAASIGVVPAAQAAAGHTHFTMTRAAAPLGHQQAPHVIRCRIGVTLRFPHPLNATGVVRCSGLVARITVGVIILRNGRRVAARVFSRSLVRGLAGRVSTFCVSGFYRAKAVGKVRLGNGRVFTGRAQTRLVRVRC